MLKNNLIGLAVFLSATMFVSCGSDEPDEPQESMTENPQESMTENPQPDMNEEPDSSIVDISVIVNEDGSTSTGVPFSWISGNEFMINYIIYRYNQGDNSLSVIDCDRVGLKQIPKGKIHIYSDVTIDGHKYYVKEILSKAFNNCEITSITVPSTLTEIEASAFEDCSGLDSITFIQPSSLTTIGAGAFMYCSRLYSITLPSTLTEIGEYAFAYCRGLHSITLPSTLTEIGNSAFAYCRGLHSITLPSSLVAIGNAAFRHCSGLHSITLPSSLVAIGAHAFMCCSGLLSITFPLSSTLTAIGVGAFEDCIGLRSVTLPSSLTQISEGAFAGCIGLRSVTLPAGLIAINGRAFYECSNIHTIICRSITPPKIGASFPTDIQGKCTVYVPYGSRDLYLDDENWSSLFGADNIQEGLPADIK